jgi:hypothetical protein
MAALVAAPVQAQTMIADAFGLYPEGGDSVRAGWSGLQSALGDPADARDVPPGQAETVLIVFGEKSIVAADGTGQAAAMLLDAEGNLVADGTMVRLTAEDGTAPSPTRNGIAARPVTAGPENGRFHAFAATGTGEALRQSARVSYRVIPALSGLRSDLLPADTPLPPEEILHLPASRLTGPSGAVPADGVAGAIALDHEDGSHSFVPATWIGGALQAPLLSRDIAGAATARLLLPFSESADVALEIARLRPGADLRAEAYALPTIGATRLALGPFTTARGHHLHDGSPVGLRVTDADGRTFLGATWLLDGVTEVTVPTREMPLVVDVTSPLGTTRLTLTETIP